MTITRKDAVNLINALQEWYMTVEPKELEKNEEGLNSKRYDLIMNKLHKIAYGKYTCKYSLEDIKKAWNNAYNEDIKTEYKGFINSLKNGVN